MGAIDYSFVFWIGADQHFAGLADGRGTDPPFACVNAAPQYTIYTSAITHIPSTGAWTVDGKYAAWGRDYSGQLGYAETDRVWNRGAIGLIKLVNRKSVQVSLHDTDGTFIVNDSIDDTCVVTDELYEVQPTTLEVSGAGWEIDEHEGKMLLFTDGALKDHQFPITSNTGGDYPQITCATKALLLFDFVSAGVLVGDSFEIHSRPYTIEEEYDAYLGELFMELTETTYYILNETFNTSAGDGYDEEWTEVS
jgi:hypothetical protein